VKPLELRHEWNAGSFVGTLRSDIVADIGSTKDYYSLLKVPTTASAEEIWQAYRALVRHYHPDAQEDDTERFRMVQEAYRVLSNRESRAAYDLARQAEPDGKPVRLRITQSRERVPLHQGEQMLYLLCDIEFDPRAVSKSTRLNLALVIDCSTSMKGQRLRQVQHAALEMVEALQAKDRLSIVTFSDRADVVVPSSLVGEARHRLHSAIVSLVARGGTEIYQGLSAGIDQLRQSSTAGETAHVILLTDGHTYGDETLALAAAERARVDGIGISALGIGEDWNDRFLDELTRRGGGTTHYVSLADRVRDVLRSEILDLSQTALRDVVLRVNAPDDVSVVAVYRAAPYLGSLPAQGAEVYRLGRLSYEDLHAVVVELILKPDSLGDHRVARILVEGQEGGRSGRVRGYAEARVKVTQEAVPMKVPPRLINVLARLAAYRLQEQAWQALEAGDVQQATQYLRSAATRLFALGHPELGQVALREVDRIASSHLPSKEGRKRLRYGTRALTLSQGDVTERV